MGKRVVFSKGEDPGNRAIAKVSGHLTADLGARVELDQSPQLA
jgi:hypothetical protein